MRKESALVSTSFLTVATLNPKHTKPSAQAVVEYIRLATRKQNVVEGNIPIVLKCLRGEESIAELSCREGIAGLRPPRIVRQRSESARDTRCLRNSRSKWARSSDAPSQTRSPSMPPFQAPPYPPHTMQLNAVPDDQHVAAKGALPVAYRFRIPYVRSLSVLLNEG